MDGLVAVDKPAGMTSHDVVDRVRRIAKTRAVGHAGTLDPFATGLLILGIGKGTKRLTALVGTDKTYETTIHLGAKSTTFDPEGTITSTYPEDAQPPTIEAIRRTLDQFRGGYEQRAPLFSAKKIQGQKLYKLARSGKADESMRPTKHVSISELEITNYTWPLLSIRVTCSSGTYIRSLADDIGESLGTGGFAKTLRRTHIADWNVKDAVHLDDLSEELLVKHLR